MNQYFIHNITKIPNVEKEMMAAKRLKKVETGETKAFKSKWC